MGPLMTSLLPINRHKEIHVFHISSIIRKRWSYALNVNISFYMHVFNFCVKKIAFCINNAFK